LRDYHDSRWQSVVVAVAEGRDSVNLPAEPEVPAALEKLRLEEAYEALAHNRTSEELSWKKLIDQSDLSMQFIAEMLVVLERNVADSICELVPQLEDNYIGLHAALASCWELRSAQRQKLDTL